MILFATSFLRSIPISISSRFSTFKILLINSDTLNTEVTPNAFSKGNSIPTSDKYATSASPVQSITLFAKIACLPDFLLLNLK